MINVIKKKGINPKNGETLYRIQWTRVSTSDEKKMARIMARTGAYSVGVTSGVLIDFPQFFVDELLNGNAVQIDGLGTFKLKVSAATSADPEKLTTRGAKVEMVFEPDVDLHTRLNNEAEFKIVAAPTAEGAADASETTDDNNGVFIPEGGGDAG